MAAPLRVVHVLGALDRGGAELRLIDLLRRGDPARVRYGFWLLAGRPGSLAAEVRDLGGEISVLRLGPSLPADLVRMLRAAGPQVVHAHVATFSGAVLAAARVARVPRRVAHFHSEGDRHTGRRGRVQRAVMRAAIDRSATDILAVSAAAMDGLWRPGWRADPRCAVIYNGLDLGPYERALAGPPPAADPAGPLLLHVGRPDPGKHRDRAVDILAALRGAGVPARLAVVGRPDAGGDRGLTRRAVAAGVGDHVTLLGERPDVPDLMSRAALLLLTSESEGLPSVVLEACAAGTPVLSSDLAGVREIARILPGVRTVPLGADDARWAAAAAELIAPPRTAADRRRALASFATTPFTTQAWAGALTRVWTAG